ncbi:MAG: 50S ribosomal protein L4 [Kiritimatiellia bacterium]
MCTVEMFDTKGVSLEEFQVDDALLVLDRGEQAVHEAITAHNAAVRRGSASTLRKGEVAGSNKKPWRQKGTGLARAGYRQSPVWRGGSNAFGPHPRSYAKKVNKKAALLAFKRVFSEKLANGEIRAVDNLALSSAKAMEFNEILRAVKAVPPVLVVMGEVDKGLARAAGNIAKVEVVRARDADVYRLMKYPVVIADREGMNTLVDRLRGPGK